MEFYRALASTIDLLRQSWRNLAAMPPHLGQLLQQLTLPGGESCSEHDQEVTPTTTRLTTFGLLFDLPVEIQIKVWHMSWESRAINLEPFSILRGQVDATECQRRPPVRRPLVFDLEFFRTRGTEDTKARISEKKARYREAHNRDPTASLIVPEGWRMPPLPPSLYIKGIAHTETLRCYQPLTFAPGTNLASHFHIRRSIRVNPQLDQVKLGGWAMNWTMGRSQPTFYHYPVHFPSLKPFLYQALIQGPWSNLRHIAVDGLFFHGLEYLQHARAYPRPVAGVVPSMYVDYRPILPQRHESYAASPGGEYGQDIINLIEQSPSLQTFTISLSDHDFDRWASRIGRVPVQPPQGSMIKTWETAHRIRLARCRLSEDVLMLGERKYDHPWAIFMLAPFPSAEPERGRFKNELEERRGRMWPSLQLGILSNLSHNLAQPGWQAYPELWGQSLLGDWHVLLSFWVSGGYRSPSRVFYVLERVRVKVERDFVAMQPAWMLPPVHGICAEDYGL